MADAQSMPATAPAQDPISGDFDPICAPDLETRRLTVSYGARCIQEEGGPTPAPLLRLQGRWLKRAGFAVGDAVKVRVAAGRLVIEKAEIERVPRIAVLAKLQALVKDGIPKREFAKIVRHLRRSTTD